MSEDKAPDSPSQGASLPQNLTEALFGPYIDQCWVTAGVGGDISTWKGHFYKRDRVEAFDPSRGHYHSIALIKKGAGSRSEFAAGILVVADDIGHVIPDGVSAIAPGALVDINEFRADPFIPETSCEVETSHGNFQMTWRIDPPETDYARWHHFLEGAKKHELLGKAFTKCTGVHYARMETGSNQPKPNRPRYKSRLAKPYNGLTYTLDELAEAFGIDMTRPSVQATTRVASGEQLSVDKLRKLLEMLPNDKAAGYGYDIWVKVGHAIYGATGGSREGLELYDWWSQQSPLYGVLETPDQKWDGFYNAGASASTLRVLIEEKYGPESTERKAASQLFAGDAFGELPDDVLEAAGAETRKAGATEEAEIGKLIQEIKATQTVPAHHAVAEDENLLDPKTGKVVPWRVKRAATRIAPPVIMSPYRRGTLSLICGVPGQGKSLLILGQAAAITCERADLVRGGTETRLPWCGDVVYVCNEDEELDVNSRLSAWERQWNVDLSVEMKHELIVVRSLLMTKGASGAVRYECLRILRAIRDWFVENPGRDLAMIVVDTLLSSISGFVENTNDEMAFVMKFLRRLAREFWCSVVFVHHLTKAGYSDEERSMAWVRGAGAITADVRGAVVLTGPMKDERGTFGWLKGTPDGDRPLIAEWIGKGNNDKNIGKVFWYERVTVNVTMGDTTDPSIIVSEPVPVLVPIGAVAVSKQANLDDLVTKIEAHIKVHGEVRVTRHAAKTGGEHTIAGVLGVGIKEGLRIAETLVRAGKAKVVHETPKKNRAYDKIEIVSDVF